MIIKNSQLNNESLEIINNLIDLDINASTAFKLMRIIKSMTSIIEDKMAMEKKIVDRWVEKDENGEIVIPKNEDGSPIDGSVNITNVEEFSKEMKDLMDFENDLPFDKINFEDLSLETAKIKDLIKIDFLFN